MKLVQIITLTREEVTLFRALATTGVSLVGNFKEKIGGKYNQAQLDGVLAQINKHITLDIEVTSKLSALAYSFHLTDTVTCNVSIDIDPYVLNEICGILADFLGECTPILDVLVVLINAMGIFKGDNFKALSARCNKLSAELTPGTSDVKYNGNANSSTLNP